MVATNSVIGNPHLAFVIDDEAKIREFMVTALEQLGMKVETFTMAKEAMTSLDAGHPAIIFLDVALLRSDAIDVIRGLSERRYGGLVQLMSGGRPSLLDAIQRIGVRHGMKLVPPLNKPIAREAIVRAIQSLRSLEALAEPDREAAPATPPSLGH